MGSAITHVLGARPNFVKAAPVIRALRALGHQQRVVHTGQHYDERMSDVFFVQLGLPEPDVNLGRRVGHAGHARRRTCWSAWNASSSTSRRRWWCSTAT